MQSMSLPKHEVVLLGVGHTNAHVLRMWRMQAPPDARLTCISNFPVATYSGMLPGVLAGQYSKERMEIDLVRLCASAGARLIVGHVVGIDREARRILFDDRAPISYDLLSIGIGSVPTTADVQVDETSLLPIKPMQTFLDRLERRLDAVQRCGTSPIRIVIVGAGAGGVEMALCLEARLQVLLSHSPYELALVHALPELISGVRPKTSQTVERELESRHVRLLLGRRATQVHNNRVTLDNGDEIPADVVIWATSAVAASLLTKLGLPLDERGFLLTRPTLQSVGDDAIYAVGDSGTSADSPTPKAGVYAVRQGPVLWENLGRQLRGEPLIEYRPQRDFLKLFNLGDGRAVAEFKKYTLAGEWMWKWKDSIDTKFMAMYQAYPPPMMRVAAEPPAEFPRCLGCGGKVGGTVLSRVLERLDVPAHEHVLLGLEARDDAAVVQLPPGQPLNVTADFFAAPFDDAHTVGRLAVLNAASDCFAKGAKPFAALALVTMPMGPANRQEELLYELLAGALYELRPMGATLVGGHTIEGPQLTIGFTMLAAQSEPPRTKRLLRPGDQLILTKPLGTGVLLAAHMRAACRAEWFEPLLHSMLLSNQYAAGLYRGCNVTGVTDVTGFGLAGHLLEMLEASQVGAVLRLSQIPLLPGAAELLASGVESTLAPSNRSVEANMSADEAVRQLPAYSALFDPQTSGGLLWGVPEKSVAPVLARLAQLSQVPAAQIGYVTAASDDRARLHCKD